MKKTAEFLFIIDVSGSMYGQKIASVNASLTECLAELKQINASRDAKIRVSIATFADAEEMQLYKLRENPEKISPPNLKVEPQEDGFYSLTSFRCLYKGIGHLLEKKKINDGNQGRSTYIVLFSDVKPVDEKESDIVFERIQQCTAYRNAEKYVAFAEEKADPYNRNTVKFVDFKADHIVRVSEMPGEISKLQMTFLAGTLDQRDNAKYDSIFI